MINKSEMQKNYQERKCDSQKVYLSAQINENICYYWVISFHFHTAMLTNESDTKYWEFAKCVKKIKKSET